MKRVKELEIESLNSLKNKGAINDSKTTNKQVSGSSLS